MISLPGGAIIGLILAVIIIIVGAFLVSNVIKFAKSQDEVLSEGYLEALAQAIDRACNEGDDEKLVWLPSHSTIYPEGGGTKKTYYVISISENGGCYNKHGRGISCQEDFSTPCIINGTSYNSKVICLVEVVEDDLVYAKECKSKVIKCYYLPKHMSDCEKNYRIEDANGNGNITIKGKVKVIIRRSGGGASGTLKITRS